MKLILLLGTLLFTSLALAESISCTNGKISILVNGKKINQPANICSDSKKELFFSKDCLEMNCPIFQALKKHSFQNYQVVASNSNPAFKLCKELGFNARIVRYHIDGKEYASGICRKESSTSFVSPSFLMKAITGN